MTRTDLLSLFAYDAWANRETLASVRPAATAAPKAVLLIGHIAGASLLWLARIRAEPASLAVWPDLPLDQCGPALARGAEEWEAYLREGPDVALAADITYTNTKGQTFASRVVDIATHVVFHSHYHRGQVASMVRAAGHTPAYTDFIHAVRSHAIGTQEVRP